MTGIDTDDELLEELAELEHEQWRYWISAVADREGDDLPDDLVERWMKNDVPYDELADETKESDRRWARKVLSVLNHHPDVVLEPSGEAQFTFILGGAEVTIHAEGDDEDVKAAVAELQKLLMGGATFSFARELARMGGEIAEAAGEMDDDTDEDGGDAA